MAVKVFHVRRLTLQEYSTPDAFAAALNAVVTAGGTITNVVSCSSIQPLDHYGYYWMDIIYTV